MFLLEYYQEYVRIYLLAVVLYDTSTWYIGLRTGMFDASTCVLGTCLRTSASVLDNRRLVVLLDARSWAQLDATRGYAGVIPWFGQFITLQWPFLPLPAASFFFNSLFLFRFVYFVSVFSLIVSFRFPIS